MYKYLNSESTAVVHLPTSRCIYLNQPSTIHTEAYIKWRDGWTEVIPAKHEVTTPAYIETVPAWIEKIPNTDPPQYVEYAEQKIDHAEVVEDTPEQTIVHEPHVTEAYIAPPLPTAEQIKTREVAKAQADLVALDLKSIRSLREYIAAKPDAPAFIKQHEADAVALRGKLK